jgi:hypothetical protein
MVGNYDATHTSQFRLNTSDSKTKLLTISCLVVNRIQASTLPKGIMVVNDRAGNARGVDRKLHTGTVILEVRAASKVNSEFEPAVKSTTTVFPEGRISRACSIDLLMNS